MSFAYGPSSKSTITPAADDLPMSEVHVDPQRTMTPEYAKLWREILIPCPELAALEMERLGLPNERWPVKK